MEVTPVAGSSKAGNSEPVSRRIDKKRHLDKRTLNQALTSQVQ